MLKGSGCDRRPQSSVTAHAPHSGSAGYSITSGKLPRLLRLQGDVSSWDLIRAAMEIKKDNPDEVWASGEA